MGMVLRRSTTLCTWVSALSNTALSTENFIVPTPRSCCGDLSRGQMGYGGEPPVKSCPGDKAAESARCSARIRSPIPAWKGPEKRPSLWKTYLGLP
jgi:hypothetical protein